MLEGLRDLASSVVRKFTGRAPLSGWQVESEHGFEDIREVLKTVPYRMVEVTLGDGRRLLCADDHILIAADGSQVFAKDADGAAVKTDTGIQYASVKDTGEEREMYDLALGEGSHCYYADGVLSHNTTIMTIFALWQAMFKPDQNIIICAHVGKGASMIFQRIKFAYEQMDNWVKELIVEYNKSSITFANGSIIFTGATTMNALRGNSATCVILDEFAFVDPQVADPFLTTIQPILSTNPNGKLFISSTPNGVGNLFWRIVTGAEKGETDWKLVTVDWRCIPGRDEAWKQAQIKNEYRGDANKFLQEYECKFLGAADSPFPPESFDFVQECVESPLRLDMDGRLKVWEEPANGRVYGIGVDVAEGVGQDSSVITVLDFTDL